jgi:hypothetical protein
MDLFTEYKYNYHILPLTFFVSPLLTITMILKNGPVRQSMEAVVRNILSRLVTTDGDINALLTHNVELTQ